jgi:hypothetical protein
LLALYWHFLPWFFGPSSDVIAYGRMENTGKYPQEFSRLEKPIMAPFCGAAIPFRFAGLRNLGWTLQLQTVGGVHG